MNDKPCWETNPELWGDYSDSSKSFYGFRPNPVFMDEATVKEEMVSLQHEIERTLEEQREYLLQFPPCREVNQKLWGRFIREFNKRTPDAYLDENLCVSEVKSWLGDQGIFEFIPKKGKNWVFVPAK